MNHNEARLTARYEVSPNVYMRKQEFLDIALDETIPSEGKQKIYEGKYKNKEDYLEKARGLNNSSLINENSNDTNNPREPWSDKEIQELNPIHIDPKIESLRHLHPEQLRERWKY